MRRTVGGAFIALSFAVSPAVADKASPRTGFVPVPGGKLFYEERGSGPAVILIHGGMLDHRMWDAQAAALARSFRVIRYDVAAHGRSPAPEGDWKSWEHLGLLMDALKLESASLVGLSMGGWIATDFAIARPGRVRSLVLLGPGLSGFPYTGRDFMTLIGQSDRARKTGDAARVADLFLRSWLAGPHRTPAEVDRAVWAKTLGMALPNALGFAQGSGLGPGAFGRLGEIRAPVLVIEGELDCEDIHLACRLLERRIPGTRRVVVRGVAHMPNMEKPDEVNRLLLAFLRKPGALRTANASVPARQEMVEVEGGKLQVDRTGEGEPVVLVPDGIVPFVGWDDVLPALASQFEVIRYARRGDVSPTPAQAPFSPLADLDAVVRHVGAGRAHLVGSSAGGGLAVDYALAHPERVASLTLAGAVARPATMRVPVLVLADEQGGPKAEKPSATLVVRFLQGAAFQAVLDNEGPVRATEMLRAARAKDRAAILFPEDELDRRARRRLADGALPEAVALFRLNAEAFPASATAWDSLGAALLAAGDRDGAKAAWAKALEVDPATASAKEALKRLE